MNRFSGKVGYGESQEEPTDSGVWVDVITERQAYGDVIRNSRKLEKSESINDNISVGNSISIVADEYARNHFFAIRYVMWQGVAWTVTNVDVEHPRLVLTLGQVYNGPFPLGG